MLEVILKSFDTPDETRVFEKGILEIVRIGGSGAWQCRPTLWLEMTAKYAASQP